MTSATVTGTRMGPFPILEHLDVVRCRQTIENLAVYLKFSAVAETMLVTAASELARNTLFHGGGGRYSCEILTLPERHGIRIVFEDDGPGIADVGLAMTNGWTSRKGLGLGLPGAKRLVNEFDLQSSLGQGTTVTITRWQARAG